jgi:transcriptional antiterminator RfaH
MWGAAFTHAQQEFIALENIEAQGWTGYLPRYEKTISHARKKRIILLPLFPRYLFINFAIKPFAHSLNNTKGIHSIITNVNRPALIDDETIKLLQSKEDSSGIINTDAISLFDKGDPIIVQTGIFKGQIATFESMTDDQKIKILVDLLGKKTSITLRSHEVTSF